MKVVLPLLLAILLVPTLSAQAPAVSDEPITPPTVVYPAEAKQKHIQGSVEIEVHVSPEGNVTGVTTLSGPPELRQAAIDAYSLASYHPLLRNGKAIPAVVHTKVDFFLHEATPSPDDLVAKEFEPAHTKCEALARVKDKDALDACQKALDIAGRFTPKGYMVAHATAFNDLAMVLLAQGKKKEAAAVGENAVSTIADAYPDSLAAANAYITRAETRSRNNDVKPGITDCQEAERILRGLIEQQAAPYLAADMKSQLKGVLRLHAALLRHSYQDGKAKQLEDEADKL
ncbi:MAG TPA: energy transducer TonB [Granulicella sp.]